MHEFSIAENIIEIIKQTVRASDLEKISSVKITFGKMSNVMPEALHSAYKLLIEDTPLSNSYLSLENSPLIVKCNNCGSIHVVDDFIFNCRDCSSSNLTVDGGDEMRISNITLTNYQE
jgi:hydrogenase nickel incorporation protein HypA/HybF